ncbi:MAG TPA: hypothetical protein PKO09_02740 [Anaerolineae bacterium]|nr:hypothetical protein [Anaerolineae bacterium]
MALSRAADLPDEADRWPAKMLVEWEPAVAKAAFQRLADDVMSRVTGQLRHHVLAAPDAGEDRPDSVFFRPPACGWDGCEEHAPCLETYAGR